MSELDGVYVLKHSSIKNSKKRNYLYRSIPNRYT